jgi:hypothetical protein
MFIINVQYFNSLVARPAADLLEQLDINPRAYTRRANEDEWEDGGMRGGRRGME